MLTLKGFRSRHHWAFLSGDDDGDDTLDVREAVDALGNLYSSLSESEVESVCQSCGPGTSHEMHCMCPRLQSEEDPRAGLRRKRY